MSVYIYDMLVVLDKFLACFYVANKVKMVRFLNRLKNSQHVFYRV